jgi:5-methylcytosine-specific restriction endonuclease McrA
MKTCSIDGCNNPVWGKGVCAKHTPKTPLKRTEFRYTPADGSKHDERLARDNFFMSIWRSRLHECEICLAKLGDEPLSYMFDHLLEKSTHPNLKFEKENIALVCLECHDKKSRGIISEKYQERINFVRTKFNV